MKTTLRRGEDMRQQSPDQIPERALAVAVLHLALSDLKSGKRGSLLWWKWPSDGLAFWCGILDLDDAVLREKALGVQPRRADRDGIWHLIRTQAP